MRMRNCLRAMEKRTIAIIPGPEPTDISPGRQICSGPPGPPGWERSIAGLTLTLTNARSCSGWHRYRDLGGGEEQSQCQVIMNYAELVSVPSDHPAPFTDQLRLAVAAYLARFKGSSRKRTEFDLRCFLAWRAEPDLDPLAARRPQLELYIR